MPAMPKKRLWDGQQQERRGGRGERADWDRQLAEIRAAVRSWASRNGIPDPEDLAQEVMAVLVARGPHAVPKVSLSFAMGIARNLAKSQWRRVRTRRNADKRQRHAHAGYVLESTAADAEWRRRVMKAVDKLGSRDREILRLKFLESMSYEQIARNLSMNAATVRQRTLRALDRLRFLVFDAGDAR
jgi:RNA polymerase sigma factor (sigma-70 family)